MDDPRQETAEFEHTLGSLRAALDALAEKDAPDTAEIAFGGLSLLAVWDEPTD